MAIIELHTNPEISKDLELTTPTVVPQPIVLDPSFPNAQLADHTCEMASEDTWLAHGQQPSEQVIDLGPESRVKLVADKARKLARSVLNITIK